jgi:16S rRNA G966 N2-methylase RsmD
MNLKLLQPQVRQYLLEHIHTNVAQFILQSHPFESITAQDLAQQLLGLQKARTKFPDWFHNKQILFPPKRNIEQSSSHVTGQYKSRIVPGNSMIDITGGMGVDVYAFAKAYSKTTHIEIDPALHELTRHNLAALATNTESHCMDGMQYLKNSTQRFDLIYIDPSRKTAKTNKAILLQEYEPNVIQHLDLLFSKSENILVKTSPLLDIKAGLQQLEKVSEIHVVAVKNEVKEVLWLLQPHAKNPKVMVVNLETDQPELRFEYHAQSSPSYNCLKSYLYEPHAGIMKSQAHGEIREQFHVSKIDQDAHLFTSDHLVEFPGRTFQVMATHRYKPKIIKRLYGNSARAVVTRNFRESVHQLRSKYKLSEHETDYLFFTSLKDQGKVVIEAKKLQT